MNLIEKYSISQVYFHTQLIDKILSSSSKDKKDKIKQPETITIKDIGFDE